MLGNTAAEEGLGEAEQAEQGWGGEREGVSEQEGERGAAGWWKRYQIAIRCAETTGVSL